jgi:N-acetylneuraminic acid mutarotase
MSGSKKGNSSSKQAKAVAKQQRKEEKKKKQEHKSEKSQKKKDAKELDGEEDIQTTIARIEQSKKTKSTAASVPFITQCPQPGPRSASTIVQSPISDELIMFGGQYYDGQAQYVYGESYRWNFHKNEWRMVEVSPSPNPRSCHQAVVHKHHMYIFGGEFSTLRQFYHYRDLWRFDIKTNTWEEIKASGVPPSQRSGHRMIVWKGYIVVFGGFHDTFRDCKYFNDLYLFNIAEERWDKIDVSQISLPSPRSGCGFFVHPTNDTAFVYGGYVRDKKVSGTDLNDMWQLSLRLQPGVAVPVKATWERLSKKGTAPSRRSGASFAVHKNRALVFGGVYDKDTQGLTMDSEFFNELYAFDMDRKRWYVLDYNLPKNSSLAKERRAARKLKQSKKFLDAPESDDEVCDQEEASSLGKFQWIFEYIDESGKPAQMVVDESVPEISYSEQVEEVAPTTPKVVPPQLEVTEESLVSPSATAPVITVTTPVVIPDGIELPPERMGASLFVTGSNTLTIYGGISEIRDREVTFDDCWTLDLNARDKWVRKLQGTMDDQKWLGDEEEEGDTDDEEFDEDSENWSSSDDSDNDDDDDAESDCDSEQVVVKKSSGKLSLKDKMEKIRSEHDLTESYTPLVSETLKDFFARTHKHWSDQVVAAATAAADTLAEYERIDINDKKEIRRHAFELAGKRFQVTAPILVKLKEYEEAQAATETANADKKRNSKR